MAVSSFSAARSLCEMRDWNVTNLELQKVLYIAHMIHLGETGTPLIREGFEAWDYGPVEPNLYHRAKSFGSSPVRNVFHWEKPVPKGSTYEGALEEADELTQGMSASKLIAVTHWEEGAWYKVYDPEQRGIKIPDPFIMQEYHDRSTD
ncbi:Panacea domain-containing protein [Pelagibacterium montanilacus]|uniref:Panacea domain-containing protein n=1 Tax=Pelagibacterium montanilacus TaxID=2185280 RepID=UPI000F8E4476|nr:type II toxin-antitoxin system antitoxin SocA domain-containing protein [Pelagibacterium montanilacus]